MSVVAVNIALGGQVTSVLILLEKGFDRGIVEWLLATKLIARKHDELDAAGRELKFILNFWFYLEKVF